MCRFGRLTIHEPCTIQDYLGMSASYCRTGQSAASFRFNFLYKLEVQANGVVSKVSELSNPQRRMKVKFVHDELFVDCMNKWTLEPTGRYFVSFYVGTSSSGTNDDMPFNYMRISGPDKQTLIIELSSSANDLLRIETK